jgi:hypothetical protein
MAQVSFGTAGYIGFIAWGQAGTVILTPDFTTFTWSIKQDKAETTRGSQGWATAIPTIKSWSWSLEMFYDDSATGAGGTAALYALSNYGQGTLMVGEFGTAAGKPKRGGLTIIAEVSDDDAFSDPMKWKVSGDGNGTPAWNYGGTW